MFRIARFFTAALAAMFLMSTPAMAQLEIYDFEKPHTQIMFFADHLGFSKAQGKFLDFDGHYILDRENPANSSVEITIDTDSLRMDTERWEDHLKNEDFFNVAEYPAMTFKSTDVEVTGDDTAHVTGDLTMLGVTKPVVLEVQHNKSGKFPMNEQYRSGFSVSAVLDRTEWGMDYGTPMMDPQVEIRIEVEGIRREEGGDTAND